MAGHVCDNRNAGARSGTEDAPGDRATLGLVERMRILPRQVRLRLKEYVEYDSRLVRAVGGAVGQAAGRTLYHAGRARQGFDILSKLHRSACPDWISRSAERLTQEAVRSDDTVHNPLRRVYRDHVTGQTPSRATAKFFDDPGRMLGSLAIVLKSPKPNEKGVLLLSYYHAFPLFAKLYNVEAIAERYHLVLEPSWSGLCNLDVLCYARYKFPVFVQVYEPRDAGFVTRHGGNLVPVPVAINWWVDHRVFTPRGGADKDIDVVMIASWAAFKRHHRFFAALRELRRTGFTPRVALLGYPVDQTREAILQLARYFGVVDQLELHEWLPPEQVNEMLGRAKVNILWSRREGENRAMIEGMFADVPCIVRDGFNYGCRYPYINDKTGCFSAEKELPRKLRWMIENHHRFSPRSWVMEHMSCQRATEILGGTIRAKTTAMGEAWTEGLAVKVNRLHDMAYWDEADNDRFQADYAYLRSMLRTV